MKKGLTVTILCVLLMLLVSCPDEHPVLKMTEPVGEAARRTTDVDTELVISNIVLELVNDSFNETAVKSGEDVASWFVSSDKRKLEVKSALITSVSTDDTNVKADSAIGKKTKVTLDLTVTPKKPTGKTPVNVAVQVPKAYSFDDERWTDSNKRISVLSTDIQITIEGEEDKDEITVGDISIRPLSTATFSFTKGNDVPENTAVTFKLSSGATWKSSVSKLTFAPSLPVGVDVDVTRSSDAELILTFKGKPTVATKESVAHSFDASVLIDYDKNTYKVPDGGLKGTININVTEKIPDKDISFTYKRGDEPYYNGVPYFTFYQNGEIKQGEDKTKYAFSVTLTGATWTDDVLSAGYTNASSGILPVKLPSGITDMREISEDKKTLTITFSGTPLVVSSNQPYRICIDNCVNVDNAEDYRAPENKFFAFTLKVDKSTEVKYTSSSWTSYSWYDENTKTATLTKNATGYSYVSIKIYLENASWDTDKIKENNVPTVTSSAPDGGIKVSISYFEAGISTLHVEFHNQEYKSWDTGDYYYDIDLTPYVKLYGDGYVFPEGGLIFPLHVKVVESE